MLPSNRQFKQTGYFALQWKRDQSTRAEYVFKDIFWKRPIGAVSNMLQMGSLGWWRREVKIFADGTMKYVDPSNLNDSGAVDLTAVRILDGSVSDVQFAAKEEAEFKQHQTALRVRFKGSGLFFDDVLDVIVRDPVAFLSAIYLVSADNNIRKYFREKGWDETPLKVLNVRLSPRSEVIAKSSCGPCKCGFTKCSTDCLGCGTHTTTCCIDSYCQCGLTRADGWNRLKFRTHKEHEDLTIPDPGFSHLFTLPTQAGYSHISDDDSERRKKREFVTDSDLIVMQHLPPVTFLDCCVSCTDKRYILRENTCLLGMFVTDLCVTLKTLCFNETMFNMPASPLKEIVHMGIFWKKPTSTLGNMVGTWQRREYKIHRKGTLTYSEVGIEDHDKKVLDLQGCTIELGDYGHLKNALGEEFSTDDQTVMKILFKDGTVLEFITARAEAFCFAIHLVTPGNRNIEDFFAVNKWDTKPQKLNSADKVQDFKMQAVPLASCGNCLCNFEQSLFMIRDRTFCCGMFEVPFFQMRITQSPCDPCCLFETTTCCLDYRCRLAPNEHYPVDELGCCGMAFVKHTRNLEAETRENLAASNAYGTNI